MDFSIPGIGVVSAVLWISIAAGFVGLGVGLLVEGRRRGARLDETMGRLGLVARRKATIDKREFESEPPIVRDQLAATEPAQFVVDVGAPVVVNGSVAALVSVGGSKLPLDSTRAGL